MKLFWRSVTLLCNHKDFIVIIGQVQGQSAVHNRVGNQCNISIIQLASHLAAIVFFLKIAPV